MERHNNGDYQLVTWTTPGKWVSTSTDNTPPNVVLQGSNVILFLGEEYQEPGFTVTDNSNGGVKPWTIITLPDFSNVGIKEVVYDTFDIRGNTTISKRLVTVVESSVTPEQPQEIPEPQYETEIKDVININLPFWLGGNALNKLRLAAQGFWNKIQSYVEWQIQQFDALTCHELILNLLAWERDVKRLDSEPEDVFRIRVKYAYSNAKDAGSKAGFERIFSRLNIQIVDIQERQDQTEWDVITILVTDSQLQENGTLLTNIINQYGRTCRRYELTNYDYSVLNLAVVEFGGSQEFTEVIYEPN